MGLFFLANVRGETLQHGSGPFWFLRERYIQYFKKMVLLGPATVKPPNFFAPSRQAKKESPCKHAPTIRHSCMTFRLGVHVGSGNHLNGQPGFTGLRLVRMFKVFGANPLLAWMVVPFHVNRKHVPFFSMAIATNVGAGFHGQRTHL